ncbi:MAG: hypothetical protein ABJI69_13290 [Balneola sp.]
MVKELTGYDLSRQWFDFTFENPDLVKPNHTAMYFFAIEHCNRLGWKEKFGFPSTMAMEAMGIKSYNTYKKTLDDIVDWGFFKMVERSKNQYSSNVIALSKNNKASGKALDKAFTKHASKQSESKESIDKQINNGTNKQENNDDPSFSDIDRPLHKLGSIEYPFDEFWDDYDKKKDKTKCEKKWKKIKESDKELIKEFIPIYKAHEPDEEYRKNPLTFLNGETWKDEWSSYPPKQTNQTHNGTANADKVGAAVDNYFDQNSN